MNPRTTLAAMLTLAGAATLLSGCETVPGAGGVSAARDERAQQQLVKAEVFLNEGLTDSALAAFGLALEENPKLTQAHLGMGDIYRERGDYQLASNAYERAIESDPNNFEATYSLGLMRQLMGNVREAIRIYLRALTIDPESFDANRDLAAAYLQVGSPGEALPYAKRAARLDPDSQAAWTNLAACYSLLGDYQEAVDAYRQAAEQGEMPEQVLLGLADAHIKLDNYARATNVLESLIRRSPSATAYERLAYTQFKTRDFEDSLKNFRMALSLDPNDTAALNGVGVSLMTLYVLGDRIDPRLRDQAIDAWRRSIKIRSNQPRIIDLLSRYNRI